MTASLIAAIRRRITRALTALHDDLCPCSGTADHAQAAEQAPTLRLVS